MHVVPRLTKFFTQLISETSGLSLADTLALAGKTQNVVLIVSDGLRLAAALAALICGRVTR